MASTLRRLSRLAAWTLYTLCIAEICVRVMQPQPLIPRYITGTPWGVRGNIPHAHYWHVTPEVRVEYRINGQGMRDDREFPVSKPAGSCRIALFGDSFFVGYELDLRDTIAAVLEGSLRAAGYRAEVLNFSVSGFGTAEMLRAYERNARRFSPDVVVFQWHYTDLDDNVRADLFRLEHGKVTPTGKNYLPSVAIQDALMRWSIYRFIADNSQLYAFVREGVAIRVKAMLAAAGGRRGAEGLAASASAGSKVAPPVADRDAYERALAARLLQYARQLTMTDGRHFLVVDIPEALSRTEFRSSWPMLDRALVDGIEVVHADQIFAPMASPSLKLYYEKGHNHLTPPAARALATTIAQRLMTRGDLDGCATGSRIGHALAVQ